MIDLSKNTGIKSLSMQWPPKQTTRRTVGFSLRTLGSKPTGGMKTAVLCGFRQTVLARGEQRKIQKSPWTGKESLSGFEDGF